MLFSTFESWYVYEHIEHYGFPSEWIGVTFSKTTFFNGLLAIFAGVLSNFCAETLGYGTLFTSLDQILSSILSKYSISSLFSGPVAPFALAIIPLVCCGLIITQSWPENYGNSKLQFAASCGQGLREIFSDRKVMTLDALTLFSVQTVFSADFLIGHFTNHRRDCDVHFRVLVDSCINAGRTSVGNGLRMLHGGNHDRVKHLHNFTCQRIQS